MLYRLTCLNHSDSWKRVNPDQLKDKRFLGICRYWLSVQIEGNDDWICVFFFFKASFVDVWVLNLKE